jgi:AhpD family alkylhydroperoxidase
MKTALVLALALSFAPGPASARAAASTPRPEAARVALLAENAEALKGSAPLLQEDAGRVPDYLRAFGPAPAAARPFADMLASVVYGDSLEPEVKLAMGYAIARRLSNDYLAAHMSRALRASGRGRSILDAIGSKNPVPMLASDKLALDYAERLTDDVNGIDDEAFRKTRAWFNDSQIVELTTTVCFFNYFSRFTQATGLKPEAWALAEPRDVGESLRSAPREAGPVPRVGLISDAELAGMNEVADGAKAQSAGGLGIGIANSQRAMMRAPHAARAWKAYWTAVRQYDLTGRELKLQVSFAVSNANRCRYCTVHQVVGLRRLGVDPAKLVAMMKDDSALTPRELAAVKFARKLTKSPASVADGDWAALSGEFGEQGAMEVLLQTCAFAFMNRFTDNLGLPSEEEAIKVYNEVYKR